jgi:hypothetical protein
MSERDFLFIALPLLARTKNVAAAIAITVAHTSLANALLAVDLNWMWIVARIQSATLIFAALAPASTTPVLMAALLIPFSTMPNVPTLRDAQQLSAVSVMEIKYLIVERLLVDFLYWLFSMLIHWLVTNEQKTLESGQLRSELFLINLPLDGLMNMKQCRIKIVSSS